MNLAAILLLALIFGLLLFDWATLKKRGRRMLLVESVIFLGGAFFVIGACYHPAPMTNTF